MNLVTGYITAGGTVQLDLDSLNVVVNWDGTNTFIESMTTSYNNMNFKTTLTNNGSVLTGWSPWLQY